MTESGRFAPLRRALRNRNFLIFLSGNVCVNLGTWIQQVAISWLAWDMTHSAAWLGAVAAAQMVPNIVFGPLAGAVTDRVNYLKLLKSTQTISMVHTFILFLLTFTDVLSIGLLFFMTLARGIINTFNRPARLVFVYNLVGPEDLAVAVGVNAMIFNTAKFIGPAVGGMLIVAGGVSFTFLINTLTFVVFLFCLFAIKGQKTEAKKRSGKGILGDAAEGLRYTFGHPGIGPFLIMLVLTAGFVRPITEFMPAFADEVFGEGVHGLAWLMSANGLGAVAAGYWMVRRGTVQGLTAMVMSNLIVFAGAVLVFVSNDVFWVGVSVMAVYGFSTVIQGIGTQVLVQTAVDGEMRGRALASYSILQRGCPAMGAIVMGWLSEYFGLRWPFAVSAALCFLLWWWLVRRKETMTAALERGPGAGRDLKEMVRE